MLPVFWHPGKPAGDTLAEKRAPCDEWKNVRTVREKEYLLPDFLPLEFGCGVRYRGMRLSGSLRSRSHPQCHGVLPHLHRGFVADVELKFVIGRKDDG
jgi:hypothetical protein